MSQSARKLLLWLALAALAPARPGVSGDLPIAEAELGAVRRLGSRLVLELSSAPAAVDAAHVAIARATEPLGWLEPVDAGPGGRVFMARRTLDLPSATVGLRAWLIGSDLVTAARQQWPIGAELRAEIDAVGLGAASVWLDAGVHHGVASGDCWWQRVNNQPVARYDVSVVGPDVCHCRVVPLVAGWQPQRGDVVALWPTPGQQRTGRAATAVSFVEPAENSQIVWVAAHPRIDVPAEPRLDFYRDGDYVAGGIVERRDPRFWHVRTQPAVGRGPVRVGDDAVIRTAADIRERRFAARVFESTPAGGLINAGEMDGLSVGDIGTACRSGRQIGRVTLARVQHNYSVAQFAAEPEPSTTSRPVPEGGLGSVGTPARLERLDEVRFLPPVEPIPPLAVIERVVDGTLFSSRITAARPGPLLRLLAVRRAGRVIGAAVLLDATESQTLGFALARSLSSPLAAGDELALAPETDRRQTRAAH